MFKIFKDLKRFLLEGSLSTSDLPSRGDCGRIEPSQFRPDAEQLARINAARDRPMQCSNY